jgi:hypothetical protein
MPDARTLERVRRDRRQGKSASTQAGEFVRQEFEHVRSGKHGARSTKQAIAIGLSEARRAGIAVPPPKSGSRSKTSAGSRGGDSKRAHPVSPRRSQATLHALQREGHSAASHASVARNARKQAHARTASERSASARKAARTRARRAKA